MATYTGENGQVSIGADSAGQVTVAEVRSWTVEHSKDVVEDTVMGDAARTYKSGLHQFSGSMEILYDDTSAQLALGSSNPDADATLRVEFYPSSAAGQKFAGNVLVTSVSRTSSYDDLVTASVNFQGSGPLEIVTYTA
jgi:predicted secreted protein|tara:strand:+ start:12851 stop:13264 length:414 start_codon:yes stop_codon:yes gene_type:complete